MKKTRRKYAKSRKFHPLYWKREKMGVSRKEVCDYLGIGWQTLWRWETFRTAPRPKALEQAWRAALKNWKVTW